MMTFYFQNYDEKYKEARKKLSYSLAYACECGIASAILILMRMMKDWVRQSAGMTVMTAFFVCLTFIFIYRTINAYLAFKGLTNGDVGEYRKLPAIGAVLLAVGCIAVGALIFSRIKNNQAFDAAVADLKELPEEMKPVMKAEIDKRLYALDYVKSVNTVVTISFVRAADGTYSWNENVKATVYVMDKFDNMIDNRQYDYLCLVAKSVDEAIHEVRHDPKMDFYVRRNLVMDLVKQRDEGEFENNFSTKCYVKTTKNKYEYTGVVDNYYYINGKEHITTKGREEIRKKYATPTPAPRARKPVTTYKHYTYTDPYDVQDYDDPEDFFEDHEDEFEDFEDAWDYWEENRG